MLSTTAIAQQHFDKTYVTASEIMSQLGISRAGFLYGRRAGKLPEPIVVNDGRLLIWERARIELHLSAWKLSLNSRKQA